MNDFRLGVKLVGGFLMTALIIVLVGLLSIKQQSELGHGVEVLGTENLPAVQNILVVKSQAAGIASLMRSLLTPYASKEQRNYAHETLIEARKIYGAAKEKFTALPIAKEVTNEWQDFNSNISKWVEVNNQAVELSKELITLDMTKPDLMKQHMADFEIAHNALLAKVGKLLLYNTAFEGGTDFDGCALGKWMRNMDTTNPQMVALVKELRPVHEELHKDTAQVKKLVEVGKQEEAREIAEKSLYKKSEQVFDIVHKMAAIADQANEKFVKMNRLLLEDGEQYQKNTFVAIDKIVKKAEESGASSVAAAQASAKRGELITIVCLVVGFALAVALGLILTRLITKPLFKGVDLAKAMAAGDLTQTMDVNQKDEIGMLAQSLNDMTKNLRRMFGEIQQGVGSVDDSSAQLAAISNQMASGAEATANRSAQVAAAAEEMSANQSSIAAAM